ncbi:dienelactone hydrolase [Azospirillum cavernae]|uniref:Dienelactone hydrolase n=1 Tax=Azospirillum cavernae TaxID=2320860 RepID=A0A418VXB9_9PROT|nr:CocE/NonD family hydrolase [Azospirillum cavernae]RJF81823.1 dienelactone hydrolase [Azospirillum cavernae]
MFLRRLALFLLLVCTAVATAAPACAQGLTQTLQPVPVRYSDGTALTLEGLLIRPTGPGPFPIAIVSHGSPRDAAERATMTPLRLAPQAQEFARRGWATLIVMRRGYGGSGGGFVESNGACDNPNYLQSGERSAEDIRQAIRFMAQQPFADASRIIAVGVSAGGLASVALSANPPPGLAAVISFAGGRGSRGDNDVCTSDRLVAAFGVFGRTARAPNLWIYAENDLFFGPELAHRFHAAFTASGGKAEFIDAPANGKDGHFLFSAAIPLWTPYVDRFLTAHNLAPRKTLIALPESKLAPPPELGERNRQGFADYLAAPDHKAFAVSPDGAFGWKSGQRDQALARQLALENCAKHTQKGCRVAVVNDTPMR